MASTLADPDLPIAKSATGITVVTTEDVTLFVRFGSPVGVPTVAKLVSVPLAGAVTVSVTLLTALLAMVPRFQITVPALFVALPLALTKLAPVGRASVTVTLLAVEGPKLVTLIVYTKLPAARTDEAAALPTATSATGVTVVTTGGVTLFVKFGSLVGLPTNAMLVSVPLAGAMTVSVTLVTAPLARLPRFQVTMPALF